MSWSSGESAAVHLSGESDRIERVPMREPARPAITLDCDTCIVRGPACGDCVVTLLIGPPPEVTLDDAEQRALAALASGGLVPPLRLVVAPDA